MEHRQGRHWLGEPGDRKVEPASAQPGDAMALRQQCGGGGAPGEDEELGVYQGDVAQHKGQAGGDLGSGRPTVSRRPPVDNVGDMHALAIQADRRQHAVEQLAGAADERAAEAVLIRTRALADDHHRGHRIAVGEDRVGRGALQAATIEAGDQCGERRYSLGAGSEPSCRLGSLRQGLGQRLRRGCGDCRGGWWGRRGREYRSCDCWHWCESVRRLVCDRFIRSHLDIPTQQRDRGVAIV
jgi:hypothetical protein